MADYRLSAKVISRSTGASSVASACYRTGERMHDIRLDQTFDFTRKQDVVYTEVMLPEHAPQEWSSPELLWNAVEAAERRKDAQLAREVQISLPCELSREQNIELAREFAQEQFISRGMVAHVSIHEKGNNPHAHIMLTTRECDASGFTLKNRDWNDKDLLLEWRKEWELVQNRHLERHYEQERVPEHERQYVDCRSLEEQGIEREPQIHMGRAYEIEQREQQKAREEGREYEPVTDRGERMQEIMQQNAQRELIAMQIRQLEHERKKEYERRQQELARDRGRKQAAREQNRELRGRAGEAESRIEDARIRNSVLGRARDAIARRIERMGEAIQRLVSRIPRLEQGIQRLAERVEDLRYDLEFSKTYDISVRELQYFSDNPVVRDRVFESVDTGQEFEAEYNEEVEYIPRPVQYIDPDIELGIEW